MDAIRFNQVDLEIQGKKIIKQVTGTFAQGKTSVLIGPSGSGKTTILKLCNGFFTPTHGDIEILNKKQNTYDMTALRKKVGIALQAAPMLKGTVAHNLQLPAEIKQEKFSDQEMIAVLESVDLNEAYLTEDVSELSGGERQRVSLARLLLQEAEILLLDEVISNLDESSMHIVEETLKKHQEAKRLTYIWITHNIEQAKRVGDDVWFLRQGYLEKAGSIDLLKEMTDAELARWMGENHV